jgi:hypothetical protein
LSVLQPTPPVSWPFACAACRNVFADAVLVIELSLPNETSDVVPDACPGSPKSHAHTGKPAAAIAFGLSENCGSSTAGAPVVAAPWK